MNNNLIYVLFLGVPFATVLVLMFVASFYRFQRADSIESDVYPLFREVWQISDIRAKGGEETFNKTFLKLFEKTYDYENHQVSLNKNKYVMYKILILVVISTVPFLILLLIHKKDLFLGESEWTNIYLYTVIGVPLILAYLLNKYINVRHYRDLWVAHTKIKHHLEWQMMILVKEFRGQPKDVSKEESDLFLESLKKKFIDDMCEYWNTSTTEIVDKVLSHDENLFQEIGELFSKAEK